MKIIIPMTGYGSRFVAAGYNELKPFIKVFGRPIIEWIVKGMYPEEEDFLFIVRKEHLDRIPGMEETLRRIAPSGTIFPITEWVKKGPVFDVLRAAPVIKDQEPCIINYCDFFMRWDWKTAKRDMSDRGCDGCIPCYTGFHPHLLVEKNVYASCRTDSENNLIEIKEKYSFEDNKLMAKHSPGVYYFKLGSLLKKYCQKLVDSRTMINGEYYASLPYNFMVQDGLIVWVPENVEFFCQWGTPEDLKESLFWLENMRRIYDEDTDTNGRRGSAF